MANAHKDRKPFDHHELSDTPCMATHHADNCPGFVKKNVVHRHTVSVPKSCYKCTAAGVRDTKRKKDIKDRRERAKVREANGTN